LKSKQGRHGITAQEPVILGNRVICSVHPDNSNGLGVCLEVNGDQVKEVWRDKLLDNYSCCNILWKEHVFGITHDDTASRVGPLSQSLITRRGRVCGLFFLVRGPRSVKLYAVWAGDENRILFYDSTGIRYAETRLSEAPDPARVVDRSKTRHGVPLRSELPAFPRRPRRSTPLRLSRLRQNLTRN